MDNPTPTTDVTAVSATIKLFCYGLLAMLGGIVREIKSDKEMSFVKFVAGGLVGIFCGVVVFCMMRHFGYDEWLTAAFTALGGYTGTPVLDGIKKAFQRALDNKQ